MNKAIFCHPSFSVFDARCSHLKPTPWEHRSIWPFGSQSSASLSGNLVDSWWDDELIANCVGDTGVGDDGVDNCAMVALSLIHI